MTADHPTPAAGDAVESLRGLTACYCDPAWIDRKLHAPQCLEEYREDVDALAAELARRDAALADLTRQRDEALADAERMRLACAIYGVGTDPNGYYAGTPGARVRELLHAEAQLERQAPVIEAARAMLRARDERYGKRSNPEWWSSHDHDFGLVAALDGLGPVDPEASE